MDLIEKFRFADHEFKYYSIKKIGEIFPEIFQIPFSLKILAENIARNLNGKLREEYLENLIKRKHDKEIPFYPSRIILQDYTGIPLLLDLVSMRKAVQKFNIDPEVINPSIQTDLVIDHSIQVDFFGFKEAFYKNLEYEYKRNWERYYFLKWAKESFKNFRLIPPGKGIIHQINIEYLTKVINIKDGFVFPDTLLGTDSHTTMVNSLGVLGWGVGGIEAEAVMLGQPYYILVPQVVGVKLKGELQEGATATDLVLSITEMLRNKNVTNKFVEFFGEGLMNLAIEDRATISNMAPECGSTVNMFPIDNETVKYLTKTGRDFYANLSEIYSKIQFFNDYDVKYDEIIEFDLGKVEPCIAGPRNPEERIPLRKSKEILSKIIGKKSNNNEIKDGAVLIAAITSCTNTSNPSLLIGAGLLAKKAYELGLRTKPYVKTSFAPGSRVVTEYLEKAKLLEYLENLGFHIVGYGCTTCIGNSGPLIPFVEKIVKERDIYGVAVLSGNRNFEGRINPLLKAAFLASPILVVAYAIAGRIDIDFYNEPLGYNKEGKPVYLRDVWPSLKEIKDIEDKYINPEIFIKKYSEIFEGDEYWNKIPFYKSSIFEEDPKSTYIKIPPWFEEFSFEKKRPKDIKNARVLLLLGDKITTDHISPAGPIPLESDAGKYLLNLGIPYEEFNTYGSRRGNHEIMVRGGFSNIKLKNFLVDKTGGYTLYIEDNKKEITTVFDAAMRYKSKNIPLIVLAGKQYGSGSSRDWAAKVTYMLGIKAVIAESFERIHKSNLVAMGILPLQFKEGESWKSLGLTGLEEYDIIGIEEGLYPRKELIVKARNNSKETEFKVITRLDSDVEVEYYVNGGILHYTLRNIINSNKKF